MTGRRYNGGVSARGAVGARVGAGGNLLRRATRGGRQQGASACAWTLFGRRRRCLCAAAVAFCICGAVCWVRRKHAQVVAA